MLRSWERVGVDDKEESNTKAERQKKGQGSM